MQAKEFPKLTIERFNYQCDNCGVKFNWDINSRWYGNYVQWDEGQPLPVFCCDGCGRYYVKKQKLATQ